MNALIRWKVNSEHFQNPIIICDNVSSQFTNNQRKLRFVNFQNTLESEMQAHWMWKILLSLIFEWLCSIGNHKHNCIQQIHASFIKIVVQHWSKSTFCDDWRTHLLINRFRRKNVNGWRLVWSGLVRTKKWYTKTRTRHQHTYATEQLASEPKMTKQWFRSNYMSKEFFIEFTVVYDIVVV